MKPKRKYREWTDNDLILAVKESQSIAEVLRKLNLVVAGGNYFNIQKNIDRLQLNIDHFTGQQWNRGLHKNIGEFITNTALRKALIRKRGLKCEECKNTTWLNKPIKIELHHIDGSRNNNIETNLQLLCPNCHAYTDTYCKHKENRIPRA